MRLVPLAQSSEERCGFASNNNKYLGQSLLIHLRSRGVIPGLSQGTTEAHLPFATPPIQPTTSRCNPTELKILFRVQGSIDMKFPASQAHLEVFSTSAMRHHPCPLARNLLEFAFWTAPTLLRDATVFGFKSAPAFKDRPISTMRISRSTALIARLSGCKFLNSRFQTLYVLTALAYQLWTRASRLPSVAIILTPHHRRLSVGQLTSANSYHICSSK